MRCAADFVTHRFPGYLPPKMYLSIRKYLLIGSKYSADYGRDILSKRTFIRILSMNLPKVDIITSDAEIYGFSSFIIYGRRLYNVLKICKSYLLADGTLIVITFCKYPESLCHHVRILTPWFRLFYICIPIYFSHASYECFIITRKPILPLFSRCVHNKFSYAVCVS